MKNRDLKFTISFGPMPSTWYNMNHPKIHNIAFMIEQKMRKPFLEALKSGKTYRGSIPHSTFLRLIEGISRPLQTNIYVYMKGRKAPVMDIAKQKPKTYIKCMACGYYEDMEQNPINRKIHERKSDFMECTNCGYSAPKVKFETKIV